MRHVLLYGTALFLFGIFIGRLPETVALVQRRPDWSLAVDEVHQLIDRRYVSQPDAEALRRGAIEGMIEALDDPYTVFVAPSEAADFEKDLTGQFVGIGAVVRSVDGWLTIVSPLEDSPALAAGILPEDRIVAIEGVSTKDVPVDECVKRLTGVPGTEVVLSIVRDGGPFDVRLTRRQVVSRAVRGVRFDAAAGGWIHRLAPDSPIAYLRISQFTPTVADEIRDALERLSAEQPPVAGLILDLRDNPGGVLEQAAEVVDLFLDEGLIVSARGRARPDQTFSARAGQYFGEAPMLVLVDQTSASASEIVAGALADRGRAVVLGVRSFGKGLVQVVEPIESIPQALLKLTEQHFYLPSGRLIQRTDDAQTWGVDPTPGFAVPLTQDEQRSLSLLRQELDILRPASAKPPAAPGAAAALARALAQPRWSDPQWIAGVLGDKQLSTAVNAMQQRLAAGEWRPPGPTDAAAQANEATAQELLRLTRIAARMDRELARLERRINTLEAGGAAAAAPRPTDLWPDAADPSGGELTVKDRDGRTIATLRITGPDLEAWLLSADVEPAQPPTPPAPSAPGAR